MNEATGILAYFSTLTIGDVFEVFFYILILVFSIHALIIVYHWFTFGTDKSIAITSTIIYLGLSSLLLIIMITLLTTF